MYASLNTTKKLILVIGATGCQGLAVIDRLLEPCEDGSPSPYAIRALTRDPEGKRAKELAAKGVECMKGFFDNEDSVAAALQGVYGAWVNTDGFTVGEQKELWAGVRIFELAKHSKVKHYVWSNLDYALKLGNWDPRYQVGHYDGKGRVAEWMQPQPSIVSDTDMSWTVVTSAPYMEMLFHSMFGPLNRREDGTAVFATPIGPGHIPMIAASDLGFFARYTFDNRALTSGVELKVGSDWVGWDYLVDTFRKVTGQKAVIVHQTYEEWLENFEDPNRPLANENSKGDGSTVWGATFIRYWTMWHDSLVKRDFDWIRKINPNGHTLESWMRATNYGDEVWRRGPFLKNVEDGKSPTSYPNRARTSLL
ncbi:hypothetical protein AcW1_006447 [Taiwanofungus camphoratus]|nr:hypothetical protein AcW1_006447 [Antrodia cinnamomea]